MEADRNRNIHVYTRTRTSLYPTSYSMETEESFDTL